MTSARVYSWASGRTPDDLIEASTDGVHWFDVVDNYLCDNLYYRAKGEQYEPSDFSREPEYQV